MGGGRVNIIISVTLLLVGIALIICGLITLSNPVPIGVIAISIGIICLLIGIVKCFNDVGGESGGRR